MGVDHHHKHHKMGDDVQRLELQNSFKMFDENNDGTIDKDEFRHVLSNLGGVFSNEEAEAIVCAADKNGDGIIDYNEFVEMIMTGDNETIKQAIQLNEGDEVKIISPQFNGAGDHHWGTVTRVQAHRAEVLVHGHLEIKEWHNIHELKQVTGKRVKVAIKGRAPEWFNLKDLVEIH